MTPVFLFSFFFHSFSWHHSFRLHLLRVSFFIFFCLYSFFFFLFAFFLSIFLSFHWCFLPFFGTFYFQSLRLEFRTAQDYFVIHLNRKIMLRQFTKRGSAYLTLQIRIPDNLFHSYLSSTANAGLYAILHRNRCLAFSVSSILTGCLILLAFC